MPVASFAGTRPTQGRLVPAERCQPLPGQSTARRSSTEGDLLTYVANGITTVRNMAGDSTHLAFRRRITAGEIVGPRIVTAGPVIEGVLSHPDNVLIADPATVRAFAGCRAREAPG